MPPPISPRCLFIFKNVIFLDCVNYFNLTSLKSFIMNRDWILWNYFIQSLKWSIDFCPFFTVIVENYTINFFMLKQSRFLGLNCNAYYLFFFLYFAEFYLPIFYEGFWGTFWGKLAYNFFSCNVLGLHIKCILICKYYWEMHSPVQKPCRLYIADFKESTWKCSA